MKLGLVTINYNGALGAKSKQSMLAACDRWGCEFIEVGGERSVNHPIHCPASMKTLLFSEIGAHLDGALMLDADTVVRSDTPSPFEMFPRDALTVVENGGPRFGDDAGIKQCEVFEWDKVRRHMDGLSRLSGVVMEWPACRAVMPYFNTGMIVAWRAAHEALFRAAEAICRTDLGLGWCDQTPLNFMAASWRLMGQSMDRRELVVNFAPEGWNWIHGELLPDWRNQKRFIYHFAGTCGRRELIEQVKWEV